jgi:selenocysteine-specific elongation factor
MAESHRLILGTAGHIDHGKTSLIRALTGVDCDRLPEEKSRGITIELGFAPLDLPDGRRLGIVDVPGHERLVRTMVAGATGIDLVLFVVAADEGMMPQSREHLAICELLGVRRGVVALTKIDAVDTELAELARLEVEEELARSPLANAPVIPVSAHTGAGLPELLAALQAEADAAEPRTVRDGPAWLPVDRVFSMKGFGTVVTGTLRGANLEEGDAVEVFTPEPGEVRTAKVRGLQVHGDPTPRAAPGSRCALNLHGIDVASVPRGSVVATPGRIEYRRRIDVELELISGAPRVRTGSSWTVHIGTTERAARLRLFGREALEPGERSFGELRFDVPVVALEADRFILRGFARIPNAGWTVGGGRVLDAVPHRGRRPAADRLADLEVLARDDLAAQLSVRLKRAGIAGISESELLHAVRSLEALQGVRAGDRFFHPECFEELIDRCRAAVAAHHDAHPTDQAVGLASVASQLPNRVGEEAVRAALDTAAARGVLEAVGSGVRVPGHAAHVADPELASRVLLLLEAAELAPENLEGLARTLSSDVAKLRPVADYLVQQGQLVRVASGLYFARKPMDALFERVRSYLAEHGEIDPSAYKELTGQSRKFTVPLMEFFDAEKLTRRRGNVRVLR